MRRLLHQLEPWRRYRPGIHVRSRMEARHLPLLSSAGLPIPECNAKLRIGDKRYGIDFLWPRQMVAVETDGRRTHDNPRAGARDSQRNRALVGAGFQVRRVGWEELRDRPDAVMAELRALLAEVANLHPAVPFATPRTKGTARPLRVVRFARVRRPARPVAPPRTRLTRISL